MKLSRPALCGAALLVWASLAAADTVSADPSDYKSKLDQLGPGDVLELAGGDYGAGLTLRDLEGTEDDWITIRGPASGTPATFLGDPGQGRNTIEIRSNVSYVALENLRIDGDDIAGVFAISASGSNVHHIRVEGCTILGHGAHQATVGLSTKTTTWGWIIRRNRFLDSGTGMYLGNSDGTVPFIGGLIEYNLFDGSRGYCFQIKHQNNRPDVPGVPTTPQRTIIRHNIVIKGDASGSSGPRPNMLLGTFPDSGNGSEDLYEVYGNLFLHNHQESLVQATGRVVFHDNVFVNCTGNTALYLTDHNGPLKLAYVYNNTFYSGSRGIRFATGARDDHMVVGNLILMDEGLSGNFDHDVDNIVDTPANASLYFNSASTLPGVMDFYPVTGSAAAGASIDLSAFPQHADFDRDFNGEPKGQALYRGAYQGEGVNPGWMLDVDIKGEIVSPVDTTPPTGTVTINGGAATTNDPFVSLELSATDDSGMGSGARMRFSNDGSTWSPAEPFASGRDDWDLRSYGGSDAPGPKIVHARFRDAAGNWSSASIVSSIELEAAGGGAPSPNSGGGCSIAPRGARPDAVWLAFAIALPVLWWRRRGP